MVGNVNSGLNNVKNIFESMECGKNIDSTDKAKAWLQGKTISATLDKKPEGAKFEIKDVNNGGVLTNLYTPSTDIIDETLIFSTNLHKTKGLDRANLMNKLIAAIDESADLICEIEIMARGLLAKDTKTKAIPMLKEYLQYYSNWAANDESSKDAVNYLAIIADTTFLGSLGWIFGPALAEGIQIILQTEPKISVIATFLAELATNVGFPCGTILILPGNIQLKNLDEYSRIVSVFGTFHSPKLEGFNCRHEQMISISNGKIPMIVFNSADLDSACEAAIEAIWGYQGQLPWSVDTILVQEDVMNDVLNRLEHKIKNVKMGPGNDKMADISFPSTDNATEKLHKIVKDATLQGIKVVQSCGAATKFQPTLLVGGRVYGNNVIDDDPIDVPVATILGFRTVNEAIALANNSRQGFAASVWTENIGLVNEVSRKLKVGTIWINGHGIFSANNTFSVLKSSGNVNIGGKTGLLQLQEGSFQKAILPLSMKKPESIKHPVAKDLHIAIATAKKGQIEWNKLQHLERSECLKKLANQIDGIKGKFPDIEQWISSWVKIILASTICNVRLQASILKSYDLKSYREPLGIIAVEAFYDKKLRPMKIITKALTHGNSVIILNNNPEMSKFYIEVCSILSSCKIPSGTINVLPWNEDVVKAAIEHNEIGTYIHLPIVPTITNVSKHFLKVKNMSFETSSLDLVTSYKNVWSNIGQSFI